MGRKPKSPIFIESPSEDRTEVAPADGLPAFSRYIDVRFERQGGQWLSRLFFVTPTQEEIDDTVSLRGRIGKDNLAVLGARMTYMNSGVHVRPPLFEYCLNLGLSEDFSMNLVRIVANSFRGRGLSSDTLADKIRAFRKLVDFLTNRTEDPSQLTLADLGKQFWMDYMQSIENESLIKAENLFNDAREPFETYRATSLGGWLGQLKFANRNRKASQEHTSELADSGYSDAVMYQLLALCIEGFQRRIGYLKRYQSLTEEDMPMEWLYPGRDNSKLAPSAKRVGNKVKGATYDTESFLLLSKWLNDEESGYQVLIDHFIMHHKAGLIQKNRHGAYIGGIVGSLDGLGNRNKLRSELQAFWNTTALWHGFVYGTNCRHILNFYAKKKTAQERNLTINQIAWCLANLLMMQTGINKEVALSIPSKGDDNRSILLRSNTVFVSGNGEATEAELFGFKERTGVSRRKVIPVVIAKESPLYEMLVDYERYVKVDFTGAFFELNKSFADNWNKAGGIADFTSVYPVIDESEKPLVSIDTKKFRKVFASGQLLNRIQGIKDSNELADKLREDLHHDRLDTTITHYLMKTGVGRSVIDMAIATITSEKLAEALCFKGKIALTEETPVKKRVFLCDCEDPTNPSHDVAIAAECKHYDLCLGCERSIVTEFHLPYICARILQYEEERRIDPYIWPATFEDRWNIAHDALDRYMAADTKHGQRLVSEAWISAKEGRVSLPPIINSNRM